MAKSNYASTITKKVKVLTPQRKATETRMLKQDKDGNSHCEKEAINRQNFDKGGEKGSSLMSDSYFVKYSEQC
jgi:hypothetical protein